MRYEELQEGMIFKETQENDGHIHYSIIMKKEEHIAEFNIKVFACSEGCKIIGYVFDSSMKNLNHFLDKGQVERIDSELGTALFYENK